MKECCSIAKESRGAFVFILAMEFALIWDFDERSLCLSKARDSFIVEGILQIPKIPKCYYLKETEI